MSDSKKRMKRQQKLLEEHKRLHNGTCYFCGRPHSASTIDHVPPKACFPDGYVPENFESPACDACNRGTKKQDQIFGLYALSLDFDESNTQQEKHISKLLKLRKGIANNYPEALPDTAKAYPIYRIGHIITPTPAAISVFAPTALKEAIDVMGKKLTHALYFRHAGKVLTKEHKFLYHLYQPQCGGTEKFTSFLNSLLPNRIIGQRKNIKDYGDRFKYMYGYKEQEDFFVFSAQFGRGIILWGIICGLETEKPQDDLFSSHWIRGACGPGATLF